jgi:hypothetical protein
MDDLKVGDFAAGDSFELAAGGGVYLLVVEEAEELPRAAREAGSFRLLFRGPAQPLLPQGTYPLKGSRRTDDIFIVPVSANGEAVRYEAIFA